MRPERVSLQSVELFSVASDDRGSLQGLAVRRDRFGTVIISKERIMRNRALHFALVFAAMGVSRAAGAAVEASPTNAQRSAVVRYYADELTSESGAARLFSKLNEAARYVCDDPGLRADIGVLAAVSRCEQEAIADAVSALSSDSLTSQYNRHYRDQPLDGLPRPWHCGGRRAQQRVEAEEKES
jgi:UrcA family protein